MTWPPTWTEAHFKERHSAKVTRGTKRREAKAAEDAQKAKVRRRDKHCRVPLCGCKTFKLALHVSHAVHKGAGGNPARDRSVAGRMVLVCSARHKENIVSIDNGTLRWRPLTKAGANGPIAWAVDRTALDGTPGLPLWIEVAQETAVQVLAPIPPSAAALLRTLATMNR